MFGGRLTSGQLMGAIGALFVVVVIGGFVWRVVHYSSLIARGELDPSKLAFLSSYTASSLAASIPASASSASVSVQTADDPVIGAEDAPITIVEFADFGCPYSREASFTLRALATTYADKIRYQYRDFPIIELHPQAEHAAEAANCAAEQGKFWEYHDKLYLNQSNLSDDRLLTFARELNLNERAFSSCVSSGRYTREVAEDYEAGIRAGVQGTPTFFINGTMIPGAIPRDILEAIIQQATK